MKIKIDEEVIRKQLQTAIEVEKNRKVAALVEDLKDATPVDTGRARDGWHVEGDKIVNEVEYISELNQGTSKQAPAMFVEKAIVSNGFKTKGVIT